MHGEKREHGSREAAVLRRSVAAPLRAGAFLGSVHRSGKGTDDTSPWQQKYICRSDGLIWNESVCLECVSSHAEASDSAVKVEVKGK